MSALEQPDFESPAPVLVNVRSEPTTDWYDDQRPTNATSVVLSNSIVALAGAGRLIGLSVLSTKASAQFIQVFDLAVLPADGAVPNGPVYTVAASSNLGLYFGPAGRWFGAGIVICNSSTSGTKTIGSADCWFDVQVL